MHKTGPFTNIFAALCSKAGRLADALWRPSNCLGQFFRRLPPLGLAPRSTSPRSAAASRRSRCARCCTRYTGNSTALPRRSASSSGPPSEVRIQLNHTFFTFFSGEIINLLIVCGPDAQHIDNMHDSLFGALFRDSACKSDIVLGILPGPQMPTWPCSASFPATRAN